MKIIIMCAAFLLSAQNINADVLIHAVAKYGPNGYETSGGSSSSSSNSCSKWKHGHYKSCSTTSITNGNVSIKDRVDLVPGISLTTTDKISLQIQGYLDTTIVVGIGVKL